jgi:hypothetical protein
MLRAPHQLETGFADYEMKKTGFAAHRAVALGCFYIGRRADFEPD